MYQDVLVPEVSTSWYSVQGHHFNHSTPESKHVLKIYFCQNHYSQGISRSQCLTERFQHLLSVCKAQSANKPVKYFTSTLNNTIPVLVRLISTVSYCIIFTITCYFGCLNW